MSLSSRSHHLTETTTWTVIPHKDPSQIQSRNSNYVVCNNFPTLYETTWCKHVSVWFLKNKILEFLPLVDARPLLCMSLLRDRANFTVFQHDDLKLVLFLLVLQTVKYPGERKTCQQFIRYLPATDTIVLTIQSDLQWISVFYSCNEMILLMSRFYQPLKNIQKYIFNFSVTWVIFMSKTKN